MQDRYYLVDVRVEGSQCLGFYQFFVLYFYYFDETLVLAAKKCLRIDGSYREDEAACCQFVKDAHRVCFQQIQNLLLRADEKQILMHVAVPHILDLKCLQKLSLLRQGPSLKNIDLVVCIGSDKKAMAHSVDMPTCLCLVLAVHRWYRLLA